jgi:hypothetical protein
MRKLIAVVVAIVASAGSAAAADASTWHASPAGGVLSANIGTLVLTSSGPSSTPLSCGYSQWPVTVAGHGLGTVNGPTLPTAWTGAAAIGPHFTGCGAPTILYTWRCNKDVSGGVDASLNATSTTASSAGSGVTTGQITGIDCTLSYSSQVCGRMTGQVGYTYDNATQRMTLPIGSQILGYGEIAGTSCPLRSGLITIKNSVYGGNPVFTVAGGPLAIWAS